jgi:hypothetical protein
MFPSTRRAITILFRTPLVPAPVGPAAVEMTSFSAGPSRPRAQSRTFSNMSMKSAYGYNNDMSGRRYASDYGKKELYSDESGSTGAGVSDGLMKKGIETDIRLTTLRTPMPRSTRTQILNQQHRTSRKR